MKNIYGIFRKISLIFYLMIFYELRNLCQYGGAKRHLTRILVLGIGLLVSIILWLFFRRTKEKTSDDSKKKNVTFRWEVTIFIIGSLIFSSQIVYSAIPFQGALSWKIDAFFKEKKVTLTHTNFLETGVEGILQDLDEELDLPEELYIANKFQLTFDDTGEIRSLYTFLYGKNENGEYRSYLVDYNAEKENKMTVWLDGKATSGYESDCSLEPMRMILKDKIFLDKLKTSLSVWEEPDHSGIYEILYYGKRSFWTGEGLVFIEGDADGDGVNGENNIHQLRYGGEVKGFALSLHIPEREEIIPLRFIMEPEYISSDTIQKQQEQQQIEESKDSQGWTTDSDNGTMYFFVDDNTGWRLIIIDAAAGSRFYALEKTDDGGSTWDRINGDPFSGSAGVAEGLVFYNEKLGVAGLAGASGNSSSLFITQDGGSSFLEVKLPMEQVEELPPIANELGYRVEDYDYLHMPERIGEVLRVCVVTESVENGGLLFQSEDNGVNWTYLGNSN